MWFRCYDNFDLNVLLKGRNNNNNKKIHLLFNTALVAIFLLFVNCWFARDVTAAMLVVKNKSISLLWELNSTFM